MSRNKEELTNELIDKMENDENGLSYKNITLTNKQLFELALCSDILKTKGLSISPSSIIRMCLEQSLDNVKKKFFEMAGYSEIPLFNSKCGVER